MCKFGIFEQYQQMGVIFVTKSVWSLGMRINIIPIQSSHNSKFKITVRNLGQYDTNLRHVEPKIKW